MGPAEAGRDEGEPRPDGRVGGVRPADGQLVDVQPARVLVERERGRDRAEHLVEALAPQQLGLVPGVGGQLDLDPLPGVREEGLVAVLEEATHPGAYGAGCGEQLLGELQLLGPPCRRHVECAGPHRGAVERGRRARPVQACAGELQGGGDEPLVIHFVEDVQVLGQARPRTSVAAADTGERQEDVGEGVAPEEIGLVQPVGEVGLESRGGRGRPAVVARMVPGLGERMQGEPQLGEGEISKRMCSEGRPAMSMCTLTRP